MTAARQKLKQDNDRLKLAWSPVSLAVEAGDVAKARSSFKDFEESGYPVEDGMRGFLADFYIKHGAMIDARKQLDQIVHRDRSKPVRVGNSMVGSSPGYRPTYCLMWLGANPSAPKVQRDAVIHAWSQGYRKTSIGPGAFQDLSPAALLEFGAGKELEGSESTRRESAAHYEKAFSLAPTSFALANQLMGAMDLIGDREGARRIALRAYYLTDDPRQKSSVLHTNGLTEKDLKRNAP